MPTFESPQVDAEESRQALFGLAHATHSIDDPRQIYPTFDALSHATAAVGQALHQLAAFHDDPSRKTGWSPDDFAGAHSASCRASWESYRAGEMLRQLAETIDHPHEAEAILAFHREFPANSQAANRVADHRIGL